MISKLSENHDTNFLTSTGEDKGFWIILTNVFKTEGLERTSSRKLSPTIDSSSSILISIEPENI